MSAARIASYSGCRGTRGDDPAHPVVDDPLRAVDRPEDPLHGLLLPAGQAAKALGVGGEVDAVGVPGVDVRGGEDVARRSSSRR